jgi:hypothetical protein
VCKSKEEERKMKVYKFNKRDTRFAPWAALCVLGLIAAMVFAVPSVVFAQTYEFSQDCETALVETEHTIRVKVTDSTDTSFGFWFGGGGPNAGKIVAPTFVPDAATGEFEYTYTSTDVGTDELGLINQWYLPLATTFVTWTDNEADLCSSSQSVLVGGRLTLNPKKKGALKIAVCATDGLDVSNVAPTTVLLAGVEPFHWKQKDSRLCPDGKDGVKDLVLKFKNRDVVKALEDSNGELADNQEVELALTGSMDDGTTFDGVWKAEIKKKGKKHEKKNHHQKKDKKEKKDKGSKK